MKKFVLMVAMVVSCVCMAQNSHAQTGRDGNTDIDMLFLFFPLILNYLP